MSSPPSPRRKHTTNPPTTTSSYHSDVVAVYPETTVAASAAPGTSVAIELTNVYTEDTISAPPTYGSINPLPSASTTSNPPHSFTTQTSTASSEGQAPLLRTESTSGLSGTVEVFVTAESSTSAAAASTRGGRRSKTHVANACNNCKRAHLSCDVERPCNRCVQTGKADSCRDVPHKKRGRPRLREEGHTKAQQLSSVVPLAVPVGSEPILAGGGRALEGPRHRRTGSLRTIRSYHDAPEASRTSIVPSRHPLGPAFAPGPRASQPVPGPVTPIAFLDMDLVIMKANSAFNSLMGVQDIRGRRLSEVARTIEGDSFQNTRNALRAEREAKEPSYLPPIFQPGLDPVSGITDRDIDEITRGFDDQHYSWVFRLAGGVERSLDVRMRLAKTSLYFVTLFLPPLPESPTETILLSETKPSTSLFQTPIEIPGQPSSFHGSPSHFQEFYPPGREAFPPASPSLYSQSWPSNPTGVVYGPPPPTHTGSRIFPSLEPLQTHFAPPPLAPPQLQQQQQPVYFGQPPPRPLPGSAGRRQSFHSHRPTPSDSSTSIGSATGQPLSASSYMAPRGSSHLQAFSTSPVATRPRSETMESLGRHVQSRLRADSGVTTLGSSSTSASASHWQQQQQQQPQQHHQQFLQQQQQQQQQQQHQQRRQQGPPQLQAQTLQHTGPAGGVSGGTSVGGVGGGTGDGGERRSRQSSDSGGDDSGSGRSPRKRRKMDLEEVLHRR
ncbi:hypothetical protein AAFC00_007084 [Neodothiora populina]